MSSELEFGVLTVEGSASELEATVFDDGDLIVTVRCRSTLNYGHCCPHTVILGADAQRLLQTLMDEGGAPLPS